MVNKKPCFPPVKELPSLDKIINSKPAKPVIINPSSNFVVCTYWWGYGRLNANVQRPCPDERKDFDEDQGLSEEIADEFIQDKDNENETILKRIWKCQLEDFHSKNPQNTLSDYKLKKLPEIIKKVREAVKREESFKKIFNPILKKSMMKDDPKLIWRDPITFEVMLENWTKSCIKAKCNYMAVEYPEFTFPGGYQLAINAKPLFIKKALEACEGRGVLYIDGDMTIHKYPNIFEMPNVDFMARGWNTDPRSSPMFRPLKYCNNSDLVRVFRRYGGKYTGDIKIANKKVTVNNNIKKTIKIIRDMDINGRELLYTDFDSLFKNKNLDNDVIKILKNIKKQHINGDICFDPYSFETSGGTMFFGQTQAAIILLDAWIAESALPEHAGKADDRILSMLIMSKNLLASINVVTLPIEYLWLTMNYELFLREKTNYKIDDIIIEHPECLTSEEAAGEEGASSDRIPTLYHTLVDEEVDCHRKNTIFYEKSYFPQAKLAETFKPYLKYIDSIVDSPMEIVRGGFGERDDIYKHNMMKAEAIIKSSVVTPSGRNQFVKCTNIPQMIANLKMNKPVFIGKGELSSNYKNLYNHRNNFELIAVNLAKKRKGPPALNDEYRPVFSIDNNILCRPGNSILIDLLALCKTSRDLSKQFNSGFMFLHRIRCAWSVDTPVKKTVTRKRGRSPSRNKTNKA